MLLYDFGFEREVGEEGNEKVLKSEIKVTEGPAPNQNPRVE